MRRTMLKTVSAGLLALIVNTAAGVHAFAADQVRVVYHLSEGLDQATRAMANIRNHLSADPSAKIVVVTHGEGIRFLVEGAKDRNGKSYDGAVAALASQGVEFKVCNNTLTAHNVPASSLLLEAKIVPSGVAEVARLQAREGYAYLRP